MPFYIKKLYPKQYSYIVISVRVPRSYAKDEGRPFGIGLHEQIPNKLELLYSKGMVVSVKYLYAREDERK